MCLCVCVCTFNFTSNSVIFCISDRIVTISVLFCFIVQHLIHEREMIDDICI